MSSNRPNQAIVLTRIVIAKVHCTKLEFLVNGRLQQKQNPEI